MTVTQKNINYEIYLEGGRMVGTVDVTHPNVQAMTQELKGAGIAGPVDSPVLGHVQDLSGTINFRTITGDLRELLVQQYQNIEFWGAVQTLDTGTGEYVVKQHKIIWRAMIKNDTLGNFNVGELQGRGLEFTVIYLKEMFDNKLVREIDKLNYIYNVGGKDFLQQVRSAVGL
ncbi:MAG: phage major tail tube protein [Chitinivibrionia bacterium]|nr:phage major tail tube protein [Chitinivibrionia bacterium]